MSHKNIAELVTKFQAASQFDEVVSCWLSNRVKMDKFTTLFTFDDIGTELPIEATLGSYDGEKFYLRSIFSKPKVYFLNDDIWLSMQGKGKITIPVDSVLALDTQFGNYATKFIADPEFRNTELGQSVTNLITYIYQNKIVFDFSFYLCENFANYRAGKKKEIEAQLVALKTLGDADRNEFLTNGIIKLPYSHEDLKSKVADLAALYHAPPQRLEFAELELLQSNIAALLLKAILLKNKDCSPSEKVGELIDFLHYDLSCILQREMIICVKWLLGQNISFFDPVNVGPGYVQVSQRVHGMAWDLMLLRHVEKYCSQTGLGKCTIAYFSSFDRRMIEVSDLWKSKGCIYPPKDLLGRYFMLSEENYFSWLSSVVGNKKTSVIFNDQAWKNRDENRPLPQEVFAIRRALEYMVVKILKPKVKH